MIKRAIDLKHHIDENGQIVKTGNGVPIPDDEPLIRFRGRDRLAVPMLLAYRELCIADGCNDFQLGQIDALIDKFKMFASANPQIATTYSPRVMISAVCDVPNAAGCVKFDDKVLCGQPALAGRGGDFVLIQIGRIRCNVCIEHAKLPLEQIVKLFEGDVT